MYKYVSLVVLCGLIFTNPASLNAEDWPTFMHDKHRSGVTNERLELPLNKSWVYKALHEPQPAWPEPAQQDFWHKQFNLRSTVAYDRAFHVVGAGDTIYFASSADDKVYALDSSTGHERWTFFTEGPVRFAPCISDNKVYAASDDGYVYCLSTKDGSLLWKYKGANGDRMIPGNGRIISMWPIRTGLLVDNGILYFAAGLFPNQGAFLSALSAEDGSVKWKQQVTISPQGYILASDERLYVPTGRTNPFIFARADGKSLKELPSGGGTFALLTENVLVTGPGRREKELNASNVETRDKIATFGGLRMLVGGPTAYMQSENQLSAFDRVSYLKLSREQSSLVRRKDEITERLKKMDKNSPEAKQLQGEIDTLNTRIDELLSKMKECYRWTVRCEYPYAMIMAGDVLFVGGEDKIAAIESLTGKSIWEASVDGKAYGFSIINGGLYVSTDKGCIYCFRNGVKENVKVIETKTDTNPYQNDALTERYAEAAKLILERTGVTKGYCLVLGCGRGRLAYELARRSDLKIICVDQDPRNVTTARNAIDKAGLYSRVVVHQKDYESLPYIKYFANLIVSDEALQAGKLPVATGKILHMLRPEGGIVALALPADKFDPEQLKKLNLPSPVDWKSENANDIALVWAKRPALDGGGEWTHAYAEPGNTACSGDKLIGGKMALQWFGRPGPRRMIDRHHRNVPPLFKDGRLFAPGDCIIYAIDAYNGTIEWQVEVPNSRRLGVFLDSSNMAVDEKCLYVAAEDKSYGIDVNNGRRQVTYEMPQLIESEPREWGYISYSGNILFGSGRRKGASYTETSYEADDSLWYRDMKLVTSDYLFAKDKRDGRLLWKYHAGLIINTTITVGDEWIYFLETDSPKAMSDKLGRMPARTLFDGGNQYLVAIDKQTSRGKFKTKIDVTKFEEPVYLNYAGGVLLLSGSRLFNDHVYYHYCAYDTRSSELRWQADHATDLATDGAHGEYNRHPTIVGETVYAWPYAYNLKTGQRIAGWEFERHGHGCGGVSASAQCLFWRGWNPWMYDLGPDGGPQRLTAVTRPGCWINIIPAGGLVLIPESSSGCTCGFALQTSLALVPE
ncbi:MAG: PQQ-binding-like beta-propeller repeat protein [Sedimentisphaerales bacterium]|nr:PQQ-binding-like beta-propeller repeat protein [Sedimentisphaerales bacterium]